MTSILRILPSVAIALFLSCLTMNSSFAASNSLIMTTKGERSAEWNLSADKINSFNDSGVVEAKGNVYLYQGDKYLKADFARYYTETKWVYLSGNVVVKLERNELQSAEAEFDLRSEVGWLKQGRIFIAGPHAYISGKNIQKHFGDVYTFNHAKITTCDGDTPAWSIVTDEATVEVDGYAHMRGSSLQIKDTPIAFTPFFLFPTKTSRQTGFLIPEFGRSSKKGLFYNQPFFWAINDSSDLTINENFMEKYGLMHGLEYRARPYSDTTAWIRFDWMYDKKKGSQAAEGPFQDEGLKRNNADRFWLRGMLDTRLPDPQWRLKADIDYVSDQNFLSDFKSGYSGFQRTQESLFELFRRDLKEKDQNRVSGVLLTRDGERSALALSSTYTQNPQLGHGNTPLSSDSTVQRLPQLDGFLYKGRIFQNIPLEAEASAQAAFLHRRNGTRGARYTIAPRLTLPITSKYGSIMISGGLTQVFYNTEMPSRSNPNGTNGPRESDESKTVPDYSIVASTDFAKVYTTQSSPLLVNNGTVGQSRWTAVKHSLQPRVEFRQRPLVDQEQNPFYDDDDRLLPKTELVYSITNVITRKKETVSLEKNKAGKVEPTLHTSYVDLMRLRIEQAYDFREAHRNDEINKYPRRPYGDLFSDLTIAVSDSLSLSTRNNWSPYSKKMTRHQSGFTLNESGIGSFYAGYDLRSKLDEYKRTRENALEYLALDANINVWKDISLGANFRYDMKNHSNKEYGLNLTYQQQCFTVTGSYYSEPGDKTYKIMFTLTGLGD